MPKSLATIYKLAESISRNENDVPTFITSNCKIECSGLHRAIKEKFYPWRDWKTKSKTGSSKKNGVRIHRQLQHYYTCIKKNSCKCGLSRFKPSKYLKAIVKWLKDNSILIDDTEVPIYDEEARVITWIDAIGHYTHNPSSLVKISLKTGYSIKYNSDNRGICFEQLGTVPCTTSNVHMLQSLYEDMIMDLHNCKPDHSFVLYVYKQYDKETDKNIGVCKKEEYPLWCRELRTRGLISDTMRNSAKSILESDLEIVSI